MDIIKRFKELRASGMNFIDAKTIVLKETGAIIDKLVEMQEEYALALETLPKKEVSP